MCKDVAKDSFRLLNGLKAQEGDGCHEIGHSPRVCLKGTLGTGQTREDFT